MTARTYAGIGARRTPAAVLAHMRQLARELGDGGWHLHSGGAQGADHAFALGAPDGGRTLFLPWAGLNGHAGAGVRVLSSAEYTRLEPLAAASTRPGDGARTRCASSMPATPPSSSAPMPARRSMRWCAGPRAGA